MKILNLYCGIGGNRQLWGNDHDITAIDNNEYVAQCYRNQFPKDTIIVGDAHEFLRVHYKEFDYIWSSPPCQSHSKMRQFSQVNSGRSPAIYPDMSLYQEVIFLRNNFDGLFTVENVKPYYEPLIRPDFELQRHLFWSNVEVDHREFEKDMIRYLQSEGLEKIHGVDLSSYDIPNKRQILRNMTSPELGRHIFDFVERKFNDN